MKKKLGIQLLICMVLGLATIGSISAANEPLPIETFVQDIHIQTVANSEALRDGLVVDDDFLVKGAEYTLYRDYEHPVATITVHDYNTDYFKQIALAPDIYTIKQTKAPQGHLLNLKSVSFYIYETMHSNTKSLTFSFVSPKPTLSLVLTDHKHRHSFGEVTDVAFQLVNINNPSDMQKGTTNKSGVIKFEDVLPGAEYEVRRVYSHENPQQTSTIYAQTKRVAIGASVEDDVASAEVGVEFIDNLNGMLVQVLTTETKEPVPNTEVILTSVDNPLMHYKAITNEYGHVSYFNVPDGAYKLSMAGADGTHAATAELLSQTLNITTHKEGDRINSVYVLNIKKEAIVENEKVVTEPEDKTEGKEEVVGNDIEDAKGATHADNQSVVNDTAETLPSTGRDNKRILMGSIVACMGLSALIIKKKMNLQSAIDQ